MQKFGWPRATTRTKNGKPIHHGILLKANTIVAAVCKIVMYDFGSGLPRRMKLMATVVTI